MCMPKILSKNFGDQTLVILAHLNGLVNFDIIGQMIAMSNAYKLTSLMDINISVTLLD